MGERLVPPRTPPFARSRVSSGERSRQLESRVSGVARRLTGLPPGQARLRRRILATQDPQNLSRRHEFPQPKAPARRVGAARRPGRRPRPDPHASAQRHASTGRSTTPERHAELRRSSVVRRPQPREHRVVPHVAGGEGEREFLRGGGDDQVRDRETRVALPVRAPELAGASCDRLVDVDFVTPVLAASRLRRASWAPSR